MAFLSFLRPYLELHRGIWYITASRAVTVLGFSLVLPFMAIYFVEERGTGLAAYGVIQLAAGVASALSQRYAGTLSDRVGRRNVMVGVLILRTVVMLALGLAVVYEAPILLLAAFLVANRMLWGAFEPAASAAVTDLVRPESRVAAFSLLRIGVNVGWAVGPALGGTLLVVHSYGAMFFVVAPATLLAAWAASRVGGRAAVATRADPAPKGVRLSMLGDMLRDAARRPAFAWFMVLGFFTAALMVQIFSTYSTFADEELGFSKSDVGLLYTVNAVVVLALQLPAVSWIGRMGLGRSVVLGSALTTVAYFAFGSFDDWWPLAVAMGVFTLGEIFLQPALNDMVAQLGDPERMGGDFGLFGLAKSLGMSLGPLFGGLVFDAFRGTHLLMWGVLGGAMALVLLGHILFLRRFSVG